METLQTIGTCGGAVMLVVIAFLLFMILVFLNDLTAPQRFLEEAVRVHFDPLEDEKPSSKRRAVKRTRDKPEPE